MRWMYNKLNLMSSGTSWLGNRLKWTGFAAGRRLRGPASLYLNAQSTKAFVL